MRFAAVPVRKRRKHWRKNTSNKKFEEKYHLNMKSLPRPQSPARARGLLGSERAGPRASLRLPSLITTLIITMMIIVLIMIIRRRRTTSLGTCSLAANISSAQVLRMSHRIRVFPTESSALASCRCLRGKRAMPKHTLLMYTSVM